MKASTWPALAAVGMTCWARDSERWDLHRVVERMSDEVRDVRLIVMFDELDAVLGRYRSRCCRRQWALNSYGALCHPYLDQVRFHAVMRRCSREAVKVPSLAEGRCP